MATKGSVLFSWDDVERLPGLGHLGFVLDQLPDAELIGALEARRGRGRDECPVSATWRASVTGVVFGRESSVPLLRELARNPALLAVCGFDPLGRQAPPRRTLARGADGRMEPALEEGTGAVSGMVNALRRRLMEELPGCGRHLGKAWTKVRRWFGCGLQLIADVEHELPVWFEVTRASRSEHKALAAGLRGGAGRWSGSMHGSITASGSSATSCAGGRGWDWRWR